MKQKQERVTTNAGWRRIIALLLAVSMLIIPIRFPGMTKAVEQTGSETVLPNMFTDSFADDRHTDGLTYKWNEQGGTNTYYKVADGCLTMGMPYSEAEGGAYNTANILTAFGKDSETESAKDYAAEWTDYTVEMKFSKVPVGTVVTMGSSNQKTTTALPTARLMFRVSLTARGYEYYFLQITGGVDKDGVIATTGTLSLQRYVYDAVQGKFVSEILRNYGAHPMEQGTWHTMKVEADGTTFNVWYDGEELGAAVDTNAEKAILSGSIGISSQGRGGVLQFDDIKVTHVNDATAFKEDFSNEQRYADGITYSWNSTTATYYKWEKALANSNCSAAVSANGTFQIFPQRSSMVYLTATMIDTETGSSMMDADALWKNYTVEGDVKRNNTYKASTNDYSASNGAYLLGRVQYDAEHNGYSYYALKCHSTSIYLIKRYYGTYTAGPLAGTTDTTEKWREIPVMSVGGAPSPNGEWRHAKMIFNENSVTVELSYAKADGTPAVHSATFVDDGSFQASVKDGNNKWTTETHYTCDPLLSGGIGLRGDYNDDTTEDNAEFDNIKVTMNDGSVAFFDDFSDESYFTGKTISRDPDTVQPWNVSYTWTEKMANANSYGVISSNQTYQIFPQRSSMVYLSGVAINPADASSTLDATATWKDYTVEGDVKRNNTETSNGAYLLGRVQYDAEHNGYSYYMLKCHSTSIYLLKRYYNPLLQNKDGSIGGWVDNGIAKSVGGTAGVGNWGHAKMEFMGSTITISLTYDDNGTEKKATLTYTDDGETYGPVLASGGIGLRGDYNDQTTEDNAEFDNIKVTMADGRVVFTEDFALPENETKETYFANCGTVAGAYVPPATNIDWQIKDGTYVADTKNDDATADYVSINTVIANSGSQNISDGWKNYALESDFMLTEDSSVAGFVARYNGPGSYYQMLLTTSGVGIYKVSGGAVTELGKKAVAITKNEWNYAKFVAEGTTLKAYLNGDPEPVVTVDISADAEAFTEGTLGLLASGIVKYDNFAAFDAAVAEARKYGEYTFKVGNVTELDTTWDIEAGWKVEDKKLVYENADPAVVGVATLKTKSTLINYYAEASVTTPNTDSGEVGIIGRYDAASGAYYKLSLDLEKGLVLYKDNQILHSVSVYELYLQGVEVKPGVGYVLNLYMHDSVIRGSVNGLRVIHVAEGNDVIQSGVTGVAGTNGAVVTSLTTVQAKSPVTELVILDGQGNPAATESNPYIVAPGKVPDIINWELKIISGSDNVERIPLDTLLEQSGFLDGAVVTDGTVGKIPVIYDGVAVDFCYQYVARPDVIEDIKDRIANLTVPAVITQQYADAVDALYADYNDLSAVENEGIDTANLDAAREAVLAWKYEGKTLGDIVFRDDFSTNETEDLYTNDYDDNGTRNEGRWAVRNGAMYDYDVWDIGKPTSFFAINSLIKKDYEVSSVSVDFQFIEDLAWAGIRFNFRNNEYYEFRVTDKSHRMYLIKNGTATLKDIHVRGTEYEFETGVWYNLRVVMGEDGWIYCYMNDKLFIQWQDKINVLNDELLTHGTVGLVTCENWTKYDNLEIRGVEHEYTPETTVQTNTSLPATEWTDDFQDEETGKNPSHWLETNPDDQWFVKKEGTNLLYGSTGLLDRNSESWLHVFETNVDYTAKVRVAALGDYPVMGLMARVNAAESYIRGGFDFTRNRWFIAVKMGEDFDEVVTYASDVPATQEPSSVLANKWYTLRLKAVDTRIELYVDGTLVVAANAGEKVMPGRVGVFTKQCDVDIDDVDLQMLSGQGRVQDGVLEYYTADSGISASLNMTFELEDGRLVLQADSGIYASTDGGVTWEKVSLTGFIGGSTVVELPNGHYVGVRGSSAVDGYVVKRSTDGGLTWTEVGAIPNNGQKYAQPGEHLSAVELTDEDGNTFYRVFYTIGNQTAGQTDGVVTRSVISDVYYSDDEGATWTKSENSPMYVSNLQYWCETHILKITKDVTDAMGNTIEAGTLIHYSTYNSSDCMRYALSYDGGKTWEGDYAMPDFPCGLNSMTIEEDPHNPGVYYMATFYNVPRAVQYGFPRHRVVLMRSTDGFNWEYLCDVDRWGDVGSPSMGDIMQGVNMYMSVSEDYVLVTFSRSDAFSVTGSHNKQVGRFYRFEKAKLEKQAWLVGENAEYTVPDKTIIAIDGTKEDVLLNSDYSQTGTFTVYYYDGTKDKVSVKDAFAAAVDTSSAGEKRIVLDYKHFRTIYTVNVVEGEAPAMNIADGKTYCGTQTVTVSDANGDLVSVTLNGQAVTLVDGEFTVAAKDGEQTIVATDKAGNVTTVTITVNATHTGGTATCTDKAKCEVCGEAYGELNADKHTKEAKWTIGADKHSKAYECCGKVVVEEAAHKGGTATCEAKAKCEVCNAEYGALAAHKGGTATCTDKAKCEVCGEGYGELNADKHTKEAKWTIGADKHSKAYECCGKVVVAEEAHEWKDGKCEECGYEAAPGTEQKPIEIPADKETVKEEAKVEAGEEKHYILDEDMAGKVITVKGEGAYIIVDGKKYEAKNGIVEVKLPTKSGKISVVIGNAGTKAGTFSITIATPSEDNSDTGDNAAIVLFGSLMALSVLAAGVLLIPDIRKKLVNK